MGQKNFDEVAVLLRSTDSVAVLKRPMKAGDDLVRGAGTLRLVENIPAGHKLALTGIAAGEAVIKYGQIIGFATSPISAGAHVHTHNLAVRDFARDYQFCVDARPVS